MSNTITIRLTPDRERLLKLFKLQHNIQKNSEAIELALRLGSDSDVGYNSKINQVAGCLVLKRKNRDANDIVRELRDRI